MATALRARVLALFLLGAWLLLKGKPVHNKKLGLFGTRLRPTKTVARTSRSLSRGVNVNSNLGLHLWVQKGERDPKQWEGLIVQLKINPF